MENILTAFYWVIPLVLVGKFAWNKFGKKLKDKNLVILGPPKSGKSSLYDFLLKEELPKEASQSVLMFAQDNKQDNKIALGDLGVKIAVMDTQSNVTRHDYGYEEKLLSESDFILYLFDISKLLSATEKDEYFKRMHKEIVVYCTILNSWQEEIDKKITEENKNRKLLNFVSNFLREPKQKIFIALGTHCDKITDLELFKSKGATLQLAAIQEDIEKLFNLKCKYKIQCLNSLVDKERTKETVNKIFEILKEFLDKDIIDSVSETIFGGEKNEHNNLSTIAQK